MMAKEYVEREAAINRFTFEVINCLGMEPTINASDVRAAIAAIPAADVVPVVRCKDCYYWSKNPPPEDGWGWCKMLRDERGENFYCAFGTKR